MIRTGRIRQPPQVAAATIATPVPCPPVSRVSEEPSTAFQPGTSPGTGAVDARVDDGDHDRRVPGRRRARQGEESRRQEERRPHAQYDVEEAKKAVQGRLAASMPTAALADVHGNLHALDAVLADPRLAEADRTVVLGDVVTGTFPAETLDRLTALPGRVSFLRGNADRLALDDPGDWYGWVRERLGSERMATVRSWPLTFAIDVEGLGSVRCCHAVPSDDERVLTRVTPEADFAGELEGIEEAIVVGGHTHVQFDRTRRAVALRERRRSRPAVRGSPGRLLGPARPRHRARTHRLRRRGSGRGGSLLGTAQCGGGRRDIAPSAHARGGHGPVGGV